LNASGVQQLDISLWSAGIYRIEVAGLKGSTLVVK
jgi:hypothetical protein